MATNKLSVNYSVTYDSGSSNFTVTWASIYSAITFSGLSYTLTADSNSTNNILFGVTLETLTTLDWTKCTSPSPSSRADLITQINALVTNSSPTFSDETLTSLTPLAMVQTDINKKLFASNTVTGHTVNFDGGISSSLGSSAIFLHGTTPGIAFQPSGGSFGYILQNATGPAQSTFVDFDDPGVANTKLVLKDGASTISGTKTFSTAPIMSSLTASSLVATDASKNLTSSVSGLSPTFTFVTSTTGIQSNDNINILTPFTPGIKFQAGGTGNYISLIANGNPATTNRLVKMQDPGADANLIYDVSAQTISGVKTFSGGCNFSSTTNQTTFGTTKTTTNNYAAPATSQTLTIPDSGHATANYMLDQMGNNSTVSQLTSINTAVTNNARAGRILLFSALSAGTTVTFTFNNTFITANSVVHVSTGNASDTGIKPALVNSTSISAGSCSISFDNRDTVNQISQPYFDFIIL